MLGVQLLMVMLLGQRPGEPADPGELVARLGASRYADREAASQALVQLGRPALVALRTARDARDPEVRNRAASLVQKIEGSLLTQPTMVRLDFDRALLTDALQSLSQQAGFKLVLYPDTLPGWKYRKVTLREPEPVPFWKAIDLLCDAALLQHNPGLHGIAGPREPTFALTDGALRTLTPNYDHGPFRVSLLGIHYQRDLNFGAPGMAVGAAFEKREALPRPARVMNAPRSRINPVTSVQFTAQLLVAAEPRLFISQSGALQITEAIDDRGNSLSAQAGNRPVVNRFAGYLGVMNGSVLQLQAQLHRPATPGETIKKLRGVIPLSISSRSPDPLVVPLDPGSVGKRFANADVQVTLHGIRTTPNSPQTQVEISVKANERPSPADNVDSDAFGDVYRPDMHRQHLEIMDSRGRLISWFPSAVDSETSQLTLTLTNVPASGPLKELRYYTLTRATLNLPFEFTDIPMP
jgi:hypothetical protein